MSEEGNSHSSALFPAYSGIVPENKCENLQQGNDWLVNSSYTPACEETLLSFRQETVQISEDEIKKEECDVKEAETEKSTTKYQKSKKESKSSSKKKHKKHKRTKSSRVEDLGGRPAESVYEILSKKIFIEETGLAPEHAYRIDCKSDKQNLAFNTFYHKHTATYFSDNKIPLGLTEFEESRMIINSLKRKKKKLARYWKKNKTEMLQNNDILDLSKPLIIDTHDAKPYIPIELSINELKTASKIDNTQINSLGIYDSATELYIQGKASVSKEAGSGGDDLSGSSYRSAVEQYLYAKTEEFNKALREDPTNEQKWIDFVAFQDDVTSKEQMKYSQRSGCLEKKVSIIEKALTHIPNSLPLAILKLEICQDLWEIDKLLNEWKQLLFYHPNNTYLWQQYILFVQSHLSYFTVSRTCKLYIKCIETLNKILSGTFQSHQPSKNLEETILDIFFQYCTFLNQCGYTEKAIATFQALIEFNMFRPRVLPKETTEEDLKTFFEPFWDSGAPRFGEENAPGWDKVFMEKKLTFHRNESSIDINLKEEEILENASSKSHVWIEFENLREQHHWLPWSPNLENKEDDCEDPDRSILVDDVSDALFSLKSEKLKFLLIVQFLRFLGVKFEDYNRTPYCNKDFLNQIFIESPAEVHPFLHNEMSSFGCTDYHANLTLLTNQQRFISLINRLFEQSIKLFSFDYKQFLTFHWIKFNIRQLQNTADKSNYKQELKKIKKLIKNLLKEEINRNNLDLWQEYARLEWLDGKFKESENVFQTAISLSNTFQINEASLWKFVQTYVELQLGIHSIVSFGIGKLEVAEEKKAKSLYMLCFLGMDYPYVSKCVKSLTEIPATTILKARSGFQRIIELKTNSMTENSDEFVKPSDLATRISCFAYFQYLTCGISTVENLYENIIKVLANSSNDNCYKKEIEAIFASYLQLYTFHSSIAIVSLKKIRPILSKTLDTFPENPYFLWLFLDLEVGSGIANYFRRYFTKTLKQESKVSLMQWLFAIIAELKRYFKLYNVEQLDNLCISETGLSWKIRSLFEKAATMSKLSHSVLLWRMYIRFELQQGDMRRTKAVFYQAIKQCPWAKVIYMDGIKCFPTDIQEILDTMMEKGLRIRTPLEEIEILLEHRQKTELKDLEESSAVKTEELQEMAEKVEEMVTDT
ncbi:protein NRDE2 homolog [Centruroides sculpturatus]|uniref:protein NRDE2 homolog n=1 Tax=Centruroides sculpturatus TaxID=218467 RepID=UPI000C6E5DF1|nr:protein NRDE2 homolog [Centruroides sculpturatus]